MLPVPFLGAAALATAARGRPVRGRLGGRRLGHLGGGNGLLLGVVRPAERRIRTSVRRSDTKAAAVRAAAGADPAARRTRLRPRPTRGAGRRSTPRPAERTSTIEHAGADTTSGDMIGSGDPVGSGEMAGAGRMLKWGAAGCDLLFVAALVLMIGQPA